MIEEKEPEPFDTRIEDWGTFDPASDIHTTAPLKDKEKVGEVQVRCATGSKAMNIKEFQVPTASKPVQGVECHKNIYSAPSGRRTGEIAGYSHFCKSPMRLLLDIQLYISKKQVA